MSLISGSINITWQLSVTAFIDAAEDGVTGTLLLSLPQMSRSQKLPIKLQRGLQKVSLPVLSFTGKDDVKLWWPRGYGKPYLYTVKVIIILLNELRGQLYGRIFNEVKTLPYKHVGCGTLDLFQTNLSQSRKSLVSLQLILVHETILTIPPPG